MRKFLLFPGLLLAMTSQLPAQWAPQTAPSGTGNLYSVYALNIAQVAACGFEKILRTTDGGNTWTGNLTVTGVNFYEIHTKENTHWYSLSSNSTWFVKLGNPNGTTLISGKPDSILSLHFFTSGCGVGVGLGGKIEATCDTRVTRTGRTSGTNMLLNAVRFADANTGCAVGSNGTITRTTNAGVNWATVTSGTPQLLNGIHFPSSTVGYAVGNNGTILKTTDAGQTRSTLTSGVANNLYGVCFVDADTGYVCGASGIIRKTKDGGATWSWQSSGTTQTLNSIHFTNATKGWAVGNNGTILVYTGISNGMSEQDAHVNLSVFPNPVQNELTIYPEMEKCAKIELKLADITGKAVAEIFKGECNGQTSFTFDSSSLSPGIYFVMLSVNGHTTATKFVKE